MLGAQFVFRAPPRSRIIAAENDEAVDKTVAFEQRNPPRLHYPGDARLRETVLERRSSGQGVNDIAHRSKANDQNVEDGSHLIGQLVVYQRVAY